jgi:hypothetical protein
VQMVLELDKTTFSWFDLTYSRDGTYVGLAGQVTRIYKERN